MCIVRRSCFESFQPIAQEFVSHYHYIITITSFPPSVFIQMNWLSFLIVCTSIVLGTHKSTLGPPSFLMNGCYVFLCPLQLYCADLVCFDYHSNCKGNSAQATMQAKLLPKVQPFLEAHSYYLNIDGEVKK